VNPHRALPCTEDCGNPIGAVAGPIPQHNGLTLPEWQGLQSSEHIKPNEHWPELVTTR
jgi:hypothetical protein